MNIINNTKFAISIDNDNIVIDYTKIITRLDHYVINIRIPKHNKYSCLFDYRIGYTTIKDLILDNNLEIQSPKVNGIEIYSDFKSLNKDLIITEYKRIQTGSIDWTQIEEQELALKLHKELFDMDYSGEPRVLIAKPYYCKEVDMSKENQYSQMAKKGHKINYFIKNNKILFCVCDGKIYYNFKKGNENDKDKTNIQ